MLDGVNMSRIYWSIAVIVVTLFVLSMIKKFLIKKVAYTNKKEQKANTFLGVLFNVLQYIVILIAAFVIMKINGINVTSLLAGLGIVATIVGLSLQDTLKDVFAGINIYNNNFYKVGDIVMWEGNKCEVKYFSARVTKFKNLMTNSSYTVNNSCITSIEKVKDGRALLIPFDMSDDKKKIDKAFNNAVVKLEADKDISNVGYFGMIEINDKGVIYALAFNANARDVLANARVYKILYEEFAKVKLAPNTYDNVKIKKDPWDK